jgi:hypothetical protein
MAFHAGLRIARIERHEGRLSVLGVDAHGRAQRQDDIDEIICATGQRPDLALTGELRVKLDPWLESNEALGPLIDPNLHSCGTVRPHGHRELAHPEPGLYTVGVKSFGRAPTFLMATGFEQVRSVVAAIAGDLEAADRVELDLPETGVCSAGGSGAEGIAEGSCCGGPSTAEASITVPVAAAASGCCGGPAKTDASACCALDEQKKAEGASGCGCSTAAKPAAQPRRAASACC